MPAASTDPRSAGGYGSVNGSPPQIMNAASRNTSANPIVIIICASGWAAKRRRKSVSTPSPTAATTSTAATAPSTRLWVRVMTVEAT